VDALLVAADALEGSLAPLEARLLEDEPCILTGDW